MIRQTTIVRLETQLDALETILAGATPEMLMKRPLSGAWSAHEHLAHLARHHDIFLDRLNRVLAENTPSFARYRAEDDAAWPGWAALPTDEAIVRLKDLRARIIAHVKALSETSVRRSGIHPRFGKQSIGEMLEFFLAHEGHHLYQVMLRLADARSG
jgi:uncharacterized damage-inducible protein DinB